MRVKNCGIRVKAIDGQDGTGEDDGTFEAIVATYDLDSYGDKIVPGAFEKTLAEWKASGDPIPVIWSHMSYDPESHIGVVEEAEERDEGLWVKGRLDLEEPRAAKVYRLMKGRRVTQFSFAYDVEEGAWIEKADDRPYYELRQLKLYEVGPCLIGVNQETELLAVKSADGRDVNVQLHGARLDPAQADAVRIAVETALSKGGDAAGVKAGRVLSAANEKALNGALDKIKDAVTDVKSVLASVVSSDDDDTEKAAGSAATTKTEHEAKPDRSAADEDPAGVKSGAPAGFRPASHRLLADLAALAAEVD
jgi:uncharacterized protein